MDSNTHHRFEPQPHQNHPPNSGLPRFRSAPSSLLVSCADAAIAAGSYGDGCEAERLVSGFIDSSGGGNRTDFGDKPSVDLRNSPRGCLGLPPRQNSPSAATSFGLVGSVAVNSTSNLSRQNSSPAGLFSQLSIQNGFADMGDLRLGSGEANLSPSTERLKSQLSLSSLRTLSPISEVTAEINVEQHSKGYGSWDDPMDIAFSLKTEQEDDRTSLCSPQKGEFVNSIGLLSRHLSLPKTCAEMSAVEKLLQYQHFVPYKSRAKRGCATHPRSIAERVRRTRISERMRKLQELVPNMDKQTNTADMLDLAVDYIKDLQEQFKTLSNYRAKCKCLRS